MWVEGGQCGRGGACCVRSSGRAVRVHSDDGGRLVIIGPDPFSRMYTYSGLLRSVISSRKIKLLKLGTSILLRRV